MKQFLAEQFDSLKAKRGLRQAENLGDNELNLVINEIIKVCKSSIIPEERQKAIIETQIIADPDFIGLNAHVVTKWFTREIEANRAKYMTLMQDRIDPEIEKREKENAEYYKTQLEEKRKSNPEYNPVEEGRKRLSQIVSNDKDVKKIRQWK